MTDVIEQTAATEPEFVEVEGYYTYEAALAQVRKAMAVRGADYVYPELGNCVYETSSGPSCILGVAWREAGYTKAFDPFNASEVWDTPLANFYTDKAQTFLTYVQEEQDAGVSWGESYRRAKQKVEERSIWFDENENSGLSE